MSIKHFFKTELSSKLVSISSRFKDDDGEIIPFEIFPVNEEDNDIIKKQCFDSNGKFDTNKYVLKLVCKSILSPNLNDSDLQKSYGVLGAEKLISKMLLSGEFQAIVAEVQDICGFNSDIYKSVDYLKN